MTDAENRLRLIGTEELLKMVPYTIQHIGRLEKQGTFPSRVKLSRRRVAWVYSEVVAWVESRIVAREDSKIGTKNRF